MKPKPWVNRLIPRNISRADSEEISMKFNVAGVGETEKGHQELQQAFPLGKFTR